MTLAERELIGSQATGKPNISALARKKRCARGTIRRWAEEGAKGTPTYHDRAGRGRKHKLPPKLKKIIRKKAKRGATTEKLASFVSKQYGIKVTRQTVATALKSSKHLMWLPISRGKQLREPNQHLRVTFCLAHQNSRFRTWIFIDAKDLYIYPDPAGYAKWRWQDPAKPARSSASGARPWVFRFYAAVAYNHKSALYFVSPTPPEGSAAHSGKRSYRSEDFISMMDQLRGEVCAWFPPRGYKIVMDHAKQHMSKKSREAMQGWKLCVMEDFPPQSWDLNVIENVWGVLNAKLMGAKATTTDGWRKAIKQAWDGIEQSTINQLVDGMADRLASIAAVDGVWVSHH